MRVSDLNEITTIDDSIQELLGDLQDLYAKRQSIVEPKETGRKGKPSHHSKLSRINNVSFDGIDLTLTKSVSPKRRSLFS